MPMGNSMAMHRWSSKNGERPGMKSSTYTGVEAEAAWKAHRNGRRPRIDWRVLLSGLKKDRNVETYKRMVGDWNEVGRIMKSVESSSDTTTITSSLTTLMAWFLIMTFLCRKWTPI